MAHLLRETICKYMNTCRLVCYQWWSYVVSSKEFDDMQLVYHYLIIPALPTESRGPILEQHRPKNANLSETGLNWSIRISGNRFSLGQLLGFQLVFVPIEFKVFKNLVLTKVEVVRIRIPLQPVLAKARPLANGKTLEVAARKEWPHAYLKIGSNEPKQMVTKSTYIKL